MASTEQILAILKRRQGNRSIRAFAKELGVSPAYLSDIYLGRRRVGPKILKPMGFRCVIERKVVFVRIK